MPKAPSSSSSHSNGAGFQSAHVLRRNQACHQCRRRKLKCDAKRPCSTCVRSHSYAVAHAPAGAELPPHPDCTFDEVAGNTTPEPLDHPKSRFERLENRINELEALLGEKDALSSNGTLYPQPAIARPVHNDPNLFPFGMGAGIPPVGTNGILDFNSFQSESMVSVEAGSSVDFTQFPASSVNALDNLAGVASLIGSPTNAHISPTSNSPSMSHQTSSSSTSPDASKFGLVPHAWPKNLPSPDLLRHLVEAFFAFHSYANQLFHGPSFMSSLTLPPTHPAFPCAPILHAICAVGSTYTAVVAPTPPPSSNDFSVYDAFPSKFRAHEHRPDSFAEMQVKFAKETLEQSMFTGKHLFECTQAQILLCWWYWCNAKWSEAFVACSLALRYAVPCGVNVCPPFNSIAEHLRPASILPPARTVIEDELRRNAFWLAYAMERTHGSGNGWAIFLDDEDVSQLLPLRQDQFDAGILVPPSERQWSHDHDVLLTHPEGQTDPFILFIKATMLLSRVKNFNLRFRSNMHKGDPNYQLPPEGAGTGPGGVVTVRDCPAFRDLDQLIGSFRQSFPAHLRNPVDDGIVDPHLYMACTAPHLAHILLHESHAMVGSSTCISSCVILNASRAILNAVYNITSTSYNLSLLGLFPMICWFMAARVLVRFLRVAIASKSEDQIATLQAEVDFFRMVISRVGEHIPLAQRYDKMLYDFILQNCGVEYLSPLPDTLPPRREFAAAASVDAELFDASQMILNSLLTRIGTGNTPP
ncbi:hypothetical protein CERSUDRAFT_110542 [Gelatoporia subvermispora B]|uniref:Zn(2)-C6 fungal-type domain-containing protein n=1 Tax=Ceriporiopsis subvermispora (strain B) TaxID=914234 RepID=M2RU79_CERS8|nr:hypothetical protein CERSUDRAFT_110542 [Gelatoporia subvermispora B]